MSTAARHFAEARTWPSTLLPVYTLYRSALAGALASSRDTALPAAAGAASRV
jgi:hypothetical protein